MANRSWKTDPWSRREDPMILKHMNRSIGECVDACPTEQVARAEVSTPQPRSQLRSEMLRLFNARWKRNEPGYRFLEDR